MLSRAHDEVTSLFAIVDSLNHKQSSTMTSPCEHEPFAVFGEYITSFLNLFTFEFDSYNLSYAIYILYVLSEIGFSTFQSGKNSILCVVNLICQPT